MTTSITSRFIILPILVVVAGSCLITGFTSSRYPSENNTVTNHSTSYLFKGISPLQDSSKENKKPDAGSSKKGIGKLIQQFVKLFKLKDDKKKKQISDLIFEFKFKDSLAFTEKDGEDFKKLYFDSLHALVALIKKDSALNAGYKQDSKKTDSLIRNILDQVSRRNTFYASKLAPVNLSDEDFILPVTTLSSDIEKASKRRDRLTLLQNIRDSVSIVREMNDSAKRKYSVTLKNKIEVYGFFDYRNGNEIQSNNLGYLNTFIYNSLYIKSETGEIKDFNGWKDAEIITTARRQGCEVGATFSFEEADDDPDEAAVFLKSDHSQATFISAAITAMRLRAAMSINISFKNISYPARSNFYRFCKGLYETLKNTDPNYKLLITVPAASSTVYPLKELPKIADRIIIDFSKEGQTDRSTATPLASLAGLKDTLSYIINSGVQKDKIVVCLPYRGSIWEVKTGKKNKLVEYNFFDTLKYKDLRGIPFHKYKSYYTETPSSYVVMDSFRITKKDTMLFKRIYYDDVLTFGNKYQFILNQEFKGVAVKYLGDDFGYTGLWDEMSYAFARPDTVVTDSIRQIKRNRPKDTDLLFERLRLYNYIMENPCVTCFENIPDSAIKRAINGYMFDLRVHEKMYVENMERIKEGKKPFRSGFEYLNHELTNLLKWTSTITAIVLLSVALFYTYWIIKKGDGWHKKKFTGYTFVALFVLLILFLFSWLFSNDLVPYFGFTGTIKDRGATYNSNGYSEDFLAYLANNNKKEDYVQALKNNKMKSDLEGKYCYLDNANCINMPISRLLIIIVLFITIGYVITRYFILQLVKKDRLP